MISPKAVNIAEAANPSEYVGSVERRFEMDMLRMLSQERDGGEGQRALDEGKIHEHLWR